MHSPDSQLRPTGRSRSSGNPHHHRQSARLAKSSPPVASAPPSPSSREEGSFLALLQFSCTHQIASFGQQVGQGHPEILIIIDNQHVWQNPHLLSPLLLL